MSVYIELNVDNKITVTTTYISHYYLSKISQLNYNK